MTSRFMKTRLSALSGVFLVSAGLLATPALALDDGQENTFKTIFGMVGLVPKDDPRPTINYRERPPLVVPPKMQLSAPLPPPSSRTAAWPQDPDVVNYNKNLAASREVVRRDQDGMPIMTPDELANQPRGIPASSRASGADNVQSGRCNQDMARCDPDIWNKLRNQRQNRQDKAELAPGVEPVRQYLTQPPKGYMAPSRVVTRTFEAPEKAISPNDATAFYRNR